MICGVSGSVRALISRQSRETRFAQTTGSVFRTLRLGVASSEVAEYILTVREDGEHFCEVSEQKFYTRRPNTREHPARDRTKAKTLPGLFISEKMW